MTQNKFKMKIIGITGGVGAGKSTVLDYIKSIADCKIIFTDDLAKDLCVKGEVCYEPLVKLLSKNVLLENGEIDRKKMAAMIYADESLRNGVNSIIHPAVYKRIVEIAEQEKEKGEIRFLFIEAALLIECGYNDFVDEMWYIYASDSVRRERLKESRGYTDERIDGIFKSQLSDGQFRSGSDFVIDNSGDPEKTYSQIRERIGLYEKE